MVIVDKKGEPIDLKGGYAMVSKCGIRGYFECGLDQSIMLTALGIRMGARNTNPKYLAGLSLYVERGHPEGEISFHSKSGAVAGRIINLERPEL